MQSYCKIDKEAKNHYIFKFNAKKTVLVQKCTKTVFAIK